MWASYPGFLWSFAFISAASWGSALWEHTLCLSRKFSSPWNVKSGGNRKGNLKESQFCRIWIESSALSVPAADISHSFQARVAAVLCTAFPCRFHKSPRKTIPSAHWPSAHQLIKTEGHATLDPFSVSLDYLTFSILVSQFSSIFLCLHLISMDSLTFLHSYNEFSWHKTRSRISLTVIFL